MIIDQKDTRPLHEAAPLACAPARSDADALEAALADMTRAFSSDFVAGRVGERHNTYQHRTRVLRQMGGQLAKLREREDAGS
ncbi:hypothetical protein [Sphingomonas sp. TDK1]|uniref:hypothetical protein n=1 Tax=Sphingomonas sp. TDK1 TaxID=453247 RepID=UPI0012ED0DDE|nr:hypothetical protein [Sphingomonas sp. TDK1]